MTPSAIAACASLRVLVVAGKLPDGSVVRDGDPPGHVTVSARPEDIKAAVVNKEQLPEVP